uniref:Reverse transcriptase domain-containing protein n=1 Tax=Tanacetum cinerariifolium TaxID=118510 RepID=A0A6L2L0U2_TANCI|nr:hypothetical protein [Tanacetum cinerariifolium]
MTRSSKKELIKPYKELEQVLHSTRKLSYTRVVITRVYRNSSYFLITKLKFEKDDKFESKGQFLKELHENTFSGSDDKDANEHINYELCNGPQYTKGYLLKEEGKTLEEAYYTQFGVPFPQPGRYRATGPGFYQRDNENPSYQERRQMMEETLSKFMAKSTKRHEHSSLIKEIRASTDAAIRNQGASIKALEIQIGKISKVLQERGFRGLPGSTETNPRDHRDDMMSLTELSRANIPFLGRLKEYGYDEKEVLREFEKLQAKDPRSFTLPCNINNIRFDKALADLGASVSVMSYSTFTNLGLGKLAPTKLIIELVNKNVKRPKGLEENVLVGIDKFVFPVDFIVLDTPKDSKTPLILGRPFLSTAHAKIDVFKRKISLRVRNEEIMFRSDSPTSHIIMNVYVLGLRERMELDLEGRLMGEALILNRSEDSDFGDFIELNDLNEPLELRNHELRIWVLQLRKEKLLMNLRLI